MAATNPKTAPAAKNTQSTKPGDPAPAAKKESVKKVTYPGLKPDEKGKPTVKLEAFPPTEGEGAFDPKVHKPLRRQDFTNEGPFLERKADELEKRAAQLRQEAKEARELGNAADRAKAKKLRTMVEKTQELRKQLAAQGIDVDALLKSMTSSDESEPSKA